MSVASIRSWCAKELHRIQLKELPLRRVNRNTSSLYVVLKVSSLNLHLWRYVTTFSNRNPSSTASVIFCTVCKGITYRMDFFLNHLKTAHDNQFKCQFCGVNIQISEAIQHLTVHNVGIYQCIYCLHGSNDVERIL